MLFNSLKYFLFLPTVVALFWVCPLRFRVPLLLVSSYLFYASWRPAFILFIFGLTLVNYWLGLGIWRFPNHKKLWLYLSIAINLSTLAFFKYFYFLEDILAHFLSPLRISVPHPSWEIILPLGISFFVFEFIHYCTDVYRGSEPVHNFWQFALFASFFPTQIAGPIKRYQNFIPQLSVGNKLTIASFDEAISLILVGLFKKALIADNLAFFVQGCFGHPELFHGIDLWISTYAFAFQIYFDFSGYTDIARGSAMLFGYKVPPNFNLPYLAHNVADFWHRWHISLSTWLRDYLFIPLGGSRCSERRIVLNLLITMTLGGLWHGAAMHYLAWGFYHGMLLAIHRQFIQWKEKMPVIRDLLNLSYGRMLSTFLTFQFICIGWVMFRADHMSTAILILKKMFFIEHASDKFAMVLSTINYPLIYPSIALLLPLLLITHIISGLRITSTYITKSPRLVKAIWCMTMVFLIMVFSPDKSPRFIYFQF